MNLFDPSKVVRLMLAYFGDSELPRCEQISAPAIPDPSRSLLVHNEHMTVTLERYYADKLRVCPYVVRQEGNLYGRKLDLHAECDAKIVLTGIMMFNFGFCDQEVRDEIVAQRVPLGRILIQHNILRQVSTDTFVKFAPDDPLVARFGMTVPQPAYGRLATIFCDERPAVDLLEIVNPS